MSRNWHWEPSKIEVHAPSAATYSEQTLQQSLLDTRTLVKKELHVGKSVQIASLSSSSAFQASFAAVFGMSHNTLPVTFWPGAWWSCNRELKQRRERWLRKRHLKIWIRAASNFIVLIPSGLIRQMLANFFGVEFLKVVSKFRKRKRKLLFCVPVLDKTRTNYIRVFTS